MKKMYFSAILSMVVILIFLASCAGTPEDNTETTSETVFQIENQTTADHVIPTDSSTTENTTTSAEPAETTREFPIYHPMTELSEKNQKAMEWTKDYLKTHKADFELVTSEFFEFAATREDRKMVLSWDFLDLASWNSFSDSAKHSIDTIRADFLKEFGQDGNITMVANIVTREDNKRVFSLDIKNRDKDIYLILSYLPDGITSAREETPYIQFGDRWYFYCGDW